MTGLQLTLLGVVAPLVLGASAWSARSYGDTYIWVAQSTYQMEKLYEKKDDAADITDKKTLGIPLTDLEKLKLKRILEEIKRLEQAAE